MSHRLLPTLLGLFTLGGLLLASGMALAQSPAETSESASAEAEENQVSTASDRPNAPANAASQPEYLAEQSATFFLEELRRRERELDERERALLNERAALQTVLAEIEERISELQVIREQIAQELAPVDRARQARIDALAEWYAGMEPSAAAEQLAEQGGVGVIVDVLMAMETSAAAAVLEQFEPQDAAGIIEEMAARR